MVGIRKAKRLCVKAYFKAIRTDLVEIYTDFRTHTMIPVEIYCTNLELIERWSYFLPKTEHYNIVECGVWRGGMIAGIAKVLTNECFFKNCTYHLYDSFEGLPKANRNLDGEDILKYQDNVQSYDYYDNCKAEQFHAMSAMSIAGIPQSSVVIHKGLFSDTILAEYPISILRLDGDLYESTKICLERLYPNLRKGGLLIIDDYFTWEGCRRAVDEYGIKVKSTNGVAYAIK